MSNINMLKPQVFKLHSGELKDQFSLSTFVLVPDFLNLPQNETFHLYWVETEPFGELVTPFKGNDTSFEYVSSCKTPINLGVSHGVAFS